MKRFKTVCFRVVSTWIMFCICVVTLSGCLTSKLTIRDKKTGMTVTIEDDQIGTYVKTIDCGRFTVTTDDEAELAEDTVLK